MIPVTTFAGQKVAVFGLGGSGLVSASALLAGGADVVAFDDDAQSVAKANAAGIPTADLRELDWSKIAALVLAPGVPLTHPSPHWSVALARKAAVEVIGDIELFCRERRRHAPDAPFVAITGTNGKSTTTALTAHLLAAGGYDTQLGGNIGTAILSLAPPRAGRVHVIEVSSYQIDLAPSLDPSVGILLNVTEDHLDRHGTLRQYAAVKERLVAGVQEAGTAIVGVDDNWSAAAADRIEPAGKRVVRVSVRRPSSIAATICAARARPMPSTRDSSSQVVCIRPWRPPRSASSSFATASASRRRSPVPSTSASSSLSPSACGPCRASFSRGRSFGDSSFIVLRRRSCKKRAQRRPPVARWSAVRMLEELKRPAATAPPRCNSRRC
jgi:UDP-N-acetylmuramoylalanine-D-glutamate ligase